MNATKNKKSKFLVVTTVIIITIFSTVTFANGSAQNFIKEIFITEKDSEKALEENKKLVKQIEYFDEMDKKNESEKKRLVNNDNEKSHLQNTGFDISNLSEQQKDKILKLKEQGRQKVGNFARQEKIIMGKLPSNQKRIKLNEVKKIISKKGKIEDILKELNSTNGAPDFIGGSGVSLLEYWMDDDGKEKVVVIIEQKDIFYAKMLDDSKVEKCEKIY